MLLLILCYYCNIVIKGLTICVRCETINMKTDIIICPFLFIHHHHHRHRHQHGIWGSIIILYSDFSTKQKKKKLAKHLIINITNIILLYWQYQHADIYMCFKNWNMLDLRHWICNNETNSRVNNQYYQFHGIDWNNLVIKNTKIWKMVDDTVNNNNIYKFKRYFTVSWFQ